MAVALALSCMLLGMAAGQPTSSMGSTTQVANTAFSADNAPLVPDLSGGWREGRATFYDAPQYFQEAFASRGPGAFGDINYGDCQYYSRNLGEQTVTYDNQAFPKDMIAALGSADPDYPGSCGRCYEIKCRNGLVIQEGTTPVKSSNGYNLQAIAPDTKDTQGRSFPGNPAQAENENFVKCWNDTDSIFVTITDTCPCTSATANNTAWCCGPVQHFDLSFWAFERLAHPLYGTQMLDFRPVDCFTKQPFSTFLPGYVNETIYGDRVESGWSYNVYASNQNQFWLKGAGVGGSNATCIEAQPQGGVTFTSRNGSNPDYQPFTKASSFQVWARTNGTSTGSGTVPQNLKLTIQNTEQKLYCGGDVILGQTVQPTSTQGDWNEFVIPLSSFGCNNPSLAQVDAIGFQNIGQSTVPFCLDNIALTGGSTGSSSNVATNGRK